MQSKPVALAAALLALITLPFQDCVSSAATIEKSRQGSREDAAADTARPTPAADAFCIDCLRVRLGPPVVVRGPFPDELDNPFTVLKLKDGLFRGFSANAISYAIDGEDVRSMGGERKAVLHPGPAGSATDCGRWINSVTRVDGLVYGLVHQERGCDYDISQTDKSVAIAVSSDEGLTWTDEGTILSGQDTPKAGTITGEGDCTMVNGEDGYEYAYCLRNSDWKTIVARAPASDLGPGKWKKFDGGWNADGLGGAATAIGFFGTASAFMKDWQRVALIANDPWFGGIRLALSADKVNFTSLKDPLLPVDESNWVRPAASDLIAYVSLLNPRDGTNQIGGEFLISYVYIPPGATFASRYLVFQDVQISMEETPLAAQAGVALSRWKSAKEDIYRTSSGPVVANDSAYRYDKALGYLLTRPPDQDASVKLEECVSDWPGHPDHLLTIDGKCAGDGYTRLRTAGWLYAASRPGTIPLYRCYDAAAKTHLVSDSSECEGLGTMEFPLGYALQK